MRTYVLRAVFVLVVLAPRPAQAWSFEVHQFIMGRAIALLPDALRPLFEKHRATVVERSIDPDTWQTAGFNEDAPNHFLDLDWEGFGPYPFRGLPRDYAAAVAKFGIERLRNTGTLPWRTDEYAAKLRRAFEDYSRRGTFGQFTIMFFSAWLAHYVSDAHVPFHAVVNHDGQLTDQHGIHARFEVDLFERFKDRLTIAPASARPITTPRDFVFEVAIEGTQLVAPILKADLAAIGNRTVYDAEYFTSFFAANRAVLERRINESITAVAGMIMGAWEAAGKPDLPLDPQSPPRRRR